MEKMHKRVRVFNNPFLERMTHVHPLTPLIIWLPLVFWLLYRSLFVLDLPPLQVLSIGVFALFVWTLTEYLLHRYLFHLEGDSALARRIQFLIHGLHHDDPTDATRLVMPPAGSIILASLLFPLFSWMLGPIWVQPFFGFFVIGYLCYDYIHFSVHHFKPRTKLGRFLKNSHMMHHYVSPNSRWGVSSPVWDYVFGTLEGDVKKEEQTI